MGNRGLRRALALVALIAGGCSQTRTRDEPDEAPNEGESARRQTPPGAEREPATGGRAGATGSAGADGSAGSGGNATQPPTAEEPAEPPPTRPRWLAYEYEGALQILRLDDVEAPETIALSAPEHDGELASGWVRWSPDGSHLAFVTGPDDAQQLWIAAAEQGFERRAVPLPGSLVELAFIGDDTLALIDRTQSDDGEARVGYHRVSALTGELEAVGELTSTVTCSADESVHAASCFGLLFTSGACGEASLMVVTESGPPRRLGSALIASGGEGYRKAELQWSPDGQYAFWWTHAASEQWDENQIAQLHVPDQALPALEVVPDGQPQVRQVHVPRELHVDAHPKGNLSAEYELVGRNLAPSGASVAYSTWRREISGPMQNGLWVEGDGQRREAVPDVEVLAHDFGWLDSSTLFFAHRVDAGQGARSFEVVVGDPARSEALLEQRTLGPFEGRAGQLQTIPTTRDLLLARAQPHSDLFILPEAGEPQSLDLSGYVLEPSLLWQGQHPGGSRGAQGVALGATLLVETLEDQACTAGCGRAHFIVEPQAQGARVRELSYWAGARQAFWAVDGTALFIATDAGLFYVPGRDYDYGYPLLQDWDHLHLPDRWPNR